MQRFLFLAAVAASIVLGTTAFPQTAGSSPPTADAGGPYLSCASEEFLLDGSGSSNVDERTSESGSPPFDTITAYDWELNGISPFDFDEATGRSPLASFPLPVTRDIGLRVTDNTALAFPSTGQPNLTGDDFTSIRIGDCACIGPVVARTKPARRRSSGIRFRAP